MIRVVTLEAFEAEDVAALCRTLFQTFGVGAESAGSLPHPEEAESQEVSGAYDAILLLEEAETVKLVADDKLLYLSKKKLLEPEGPTGRPPTYGLAEYGGQKAVVTTALFPKKLKEGSDEFRKRLAKQAIRELGYLWGLHSCVDAKCAMHPPWTENFSANEEPVFCNFCREQTEQKIQLGQG